MRFVVWKQTVVFICRILLAAVFIWAGIGKILRPAEFSDAVAAFRILPITSTNIVAIILPWVELLTGLSLLFGVMRRSGALLCVILNLIFIAAIISAMARGLDIECGCFTLSRAHDRVGWSLMARDIALVVLCLPVLLISKKDRHRLNKVKLTLKKDRSVACCAGVEE
jgi:uncharacterized membrane protein YphA (DoxX/SURF4 family)